MPQIINHKKSLPLHAASFININANTLPLYAVSFSGSAPSVGQVGFANLCVQ